MYVCTHVMYMWYFPTSRWYYQIKLENLLKEVYSNWLREKCVDIKIPKTPKNIGTNPNVFQVHV